MISDDAVRALHDRATRGRILSGEVQAQLEQWYAAQDNAEQGILSFVAASPTTPDLLEQVKTALERCVTLAQHIHELSHHNDDLRRDIAQLRQKMARHLQPG